ncbi:MAG: hypothetical protein IPH16_07145 [Haliscomenobacter sp.]|nr:hypothetical protein [Haliscomenobacter sp.]
MGLLHLEGFDFSAPFIGVEGKQRLAPFDVHRRAVVGGIFFVEIIETGEIGVHRHRAPRQRDHLKQAKTRLGYVLRARQVAHAAVVLPHLEKIAAIRGQPRLETELGLEPR